MLMVQDVFDGGEQGQALLQEDGMLTEIGMALQEMERPTSSRLTGAQRLLQEQQGSSRALLRETGKNLPEQALSDSIFRLPELCWCPLPAPNLESTSVFTLKIRI